LETIAAALLAWLVSKTGLAVSDAPRLMRVPKYQMVELAYGQKPPLLTSVSGLYDPKTSTIYLLDSWDDANLLDRSTLVHELAHHLQVMNKVPTLCFNAYERQAIELQLAWLREQGVEDPYAFLRISDLYIMLISACRDSDQ
jgi:hypothetical protein